MFSQFMMSRRGGGAGVVPFRQAATRASLPDSASALKGAMYRSLHTAAVDISELKLVFPNWYYWGDSGSDLTIKVGIEYPIGTTPVRLSFGGADSAVIPGGAEAVSDALPVDIPAGAEFGVRTWASAPGGLPTASARSRAHNLRIAFSTSGDVADDSLTTIATGSPVTAGYVPMIIAARHQEPALMMLGDSRIRAIDDDADAEYVGWTERVLGGANVAYADWSKSGSGAPYFLASAESVRMAGYAEYFSQILCNYGTNDLSTGTSEADLIADLQGIYTRFDISVAQTTITHRTSCSNNDWLSTATQTQIGNPAVVDDFNASLRAGLSGVDKVVDVEAIATPTGVWVATWTDDGVHANEAGSAGIAAALSASDLLV